MLTSSVVFLLGLGILYLGADWLVQGATSVAIRFGIPMLVVGLTIVALGTSMPEFLLNFFAVIVGEDSLAVGNIVGSNISNIALILGVSSVIYPITVGRGALRREYPMMLAATFLFWALSADGLVSRTDGIVLVVGLGAFMFYLVRSAQEGRREHREAEPEDRAAYIRKYDPLQADEPKSIVGRFLNWLTRGSTAWIRAILLFAGMVGLAVGARLMVESAVDIAEYLEISHVVIGLTIVAIGTSLPELAASVMCAVRQDSDLSVGNILGSNMLNILFVVGTVALIRPMHVETASITSHFPVMIGFSLLLYPIARSGCTISRFGGVVLLAGFAVYLLWLILPFV
ncbi:MAG: calcium/sodium antiporter [Rhodothermales bacterium]|nr:calcium/sodium antiporter [Rhodothermales bacterium]